MRQAQTAGCPVAVAEILLLQPGHQGVQRAICGLRAADARGTRIPRRGSIGQVRQCSLQQVAVHGSHPDLRARLGEEPAGVRRAQAERPAQPGDHARVGVRFGREPAKETVICPGHVAANRASGRLEQVLSAEQGKGRRASREWGGARHGRRLLGKEKAEAISRASAHAGLITTSHSRVRGKPAAGAIPWYHRALAFRLRALGPDSPLR
jgi:hypothetical protein